MGGLLSGIGRRRATVQGGHLRATAPCAARVSRRRAVCLMSAERRVVRTARPPERGEEGACSEYSTEKTGG